MPSRYHAPTLVLCRKYRRMTAERLSLFRVAWFLSRLLLDSLARALEHHEVPEGRSHTIIRSYTHTRVHSYFHTLILPYSYNLILAYPHSLLLSYIHTLILSYPRTLVLSYPLTLLFSRAKPPTSARSARVRPPHASMRSRFRALVIS